MTIDKLTDALFWDWERLLQSLGIEQVSAQQAFAHLVAAYSSPGRYYHTLSHIQHVLSTIQTLQFQTKDLTVVQLAAWFHDVVYDSQAQDNEQRSADYAYRLLQSLNIPSGVIADVTRLILNTKHHQAEPDDFDSQVLLDADLAILGSNPVQYQEYAHAIRQEYAWILERQYIKGRRQVLEKFLQRERIYFIAKMFEVAEPSARRNLKAEIQSLLGCHHS